MPVPEDPLTRTIRRAASGNHVGAPEADEFSMV